MKIFKSFWIVLIIFFVFIFGCVNTNPIDLGPSEISDTGNDPESPAYAIDIVTDDDFVDLINQIASTSNGENTTSSKNSKDLLKTPIPLTENVSYKNEYDQLIKIFDAISSKEKLINKMKQFRKAVNNLLKYENRYEYYAEVTGNAKNKLETTLRQLKDLDSSASSTNLYIDFRDVMVLNLLIEPFIFVHDNHDKLVKIIRDSSENNIEPIIREEFTNLVSTFEASYSNIDFSYFSNPTFLNDLKNTLDKISDISEDKNYLDLNDIFVPEAFVLNWVDDAINLSDLLIKTIVEINEYEIRKTDENGFRKDGKTTIWTFGENKADNISITLEWYNTPLIEEDIPKGASITLNDKEVNTSTTAIDVLKILDSALPDNTLTLNINFATPINLESTATINYSLKLDFEKLNTSALDLKNCNLKINDGILDILNVASITELTMAINTQNVDILNSYLTFISKNLEFVSFSYDSDSNTTTINFEYNLENGAVIETLDIKFEGITIYELINMSLSFQNNNSYLNPQSLLLLKKINH
ncbi:archaellum component FlaF (FlaF/FlaG flagellin family) [Thermosipho japonicus]|uniref:Archaellum component FlaF (FlaF/FlaG flagellin family) n=1 Tax=Thermosipho japonicus TaxID=90323 RepID=A0A841GRI3_9BACT|nr:hypothetical protein [Thermosipho japonicus]MBB6062118.1 archaellum component FlaF (FlaF/FlaG flagellin family) [Thermosipho japonicus]